VDGEAVAANVDTVESRGAAANQETGTSSGPQESSSAVVAMVAN